MWENLAETHSEIHKLWELPTVKAATTWEKLAVPMRKDTFQPPSNHPASTSFCLSKEEARGWLCGLWAATVATTCTTMCFPHLLLARCSFKITVCFKPFSPHSKLIEKILSLASILTEEKTKAQESWPAHLGSLCKWGVKLVKLKMVPRTKAIFHQTLCSESNTGGVLFSLTASSSSSDSACTQGRETPVLGTVSVSLLVCEGRLLLVEIKVPDKK